MNKKDVACPCSSIIVGASFPFLYVGKWSLRFADRIYKYNQKAVLKTVENA